ncbi:MAG: HK97 family phage prohead protease, partial [Mesorhizobium sp.]
MDIGCIGAPCEIKFASDGGTPGTFDGYAAVFGNIDSHGDVIEPGAFAKSLLDRQREGRALPPMYKMHGAMTGNRHEPIGVWDAMSEDSAGLHVKGRLIGLDTEQGKWNYAQAREGGFKGLSIGYRVPPHGAKSGSG